MDWRIYYADGSSYEGSDPTAIPLGKRFAVQIVVQKDHDHGRELCHFADYYVYRSDLGRWIGVAGDTSALMALTVDTEKVTSLLWGSMMDPYDWAEIQRAAREDPGFPPWNGGQRSADKVKK